MPQLDGLRAVAVTVVVIFHARSGILPGGYIGVDIFFVLSGYLITAILLRDLERTGKIDIRQFYYRRALRLLPALGALCVVVGLVFSFDNALPDRGAALVGVLGAATYSTSWLAAFDVSGLGAMLPTWSLSVEEHFYLAWPLVLALCFRTKRLLVPAVATVTALSACYVLVAYDVLGWSVLRVHYGLDMRASQLLVGCLLAVLMHRLPLNLDPPSGILRLCC